ncbi:MAG: L,D-transpeptidase [Patescibacteria group bacterium]|nr:L,D-transpeptidase [Patescibacteria group bacterium]
MKKTNVQGFIKLTIFTIGLIVGGNILSNNLFTIVTTAHAAGSKPIIQEIRQPTTSRGWIKIYLASAPIKVIFENSSWVVSKNDVRGWITTTSGVTSVNSSSFVNMIASQVNISATTDHDGRNVDTNNLANQINDVLTSGRPNKTISLETTVIPRINPDTRAGRYPGRYVDINLSEQTLYAFEGNTLINQFLISSGVSSHPSPVGEFSVYGKTSLQKMSGPGYYLPNVPWISWFSGDYSIHGTYWHHNFGTPMSHGCINASIADAEWIFNWDDVGTPIYIHY